MNFLTGGLLSASPGGAAVGVTGAACALHHSGGFGGGVTGCAGTKRCSVEMHYSSHILNLRPPPPFHPAHPTGTPPPIWDVRPCCPTACPLSSGATCPPPPTPINLISLPLCSPPEHDFSSHSCNPHCDFATRRRCT